MPEQLKRYLVERNRRQKLSLVIVTWKVMLKSALKGIVNWPIKQDLAVVQGLCTMSRRPSVQRGRIGNGARIVKKNRLSNCLKIIILGTKTIIWYVNKTGTSRHKMDKSL